MDKESVCNVGEPCSIPGLGRSLEREMATHSSIPVWRIPWTEEPSGLQSMGSQRVGHDSVTNTFIDKEIDYRYRYESFFTEDPSSKRGYSPTAGSSSVHTSNSVPGSDTSVRELIKRNISTDKKMGGSGFKNAFYA